MFSPSLVSVLCQLIRPSSARAGRFEYSDMRKAAEALRGALPCWDRKVPVVARSHRARDLTASLVRNAWLESSRTARSDGAGLVWGKVPVSALVNYLCEYYEIPAEKEYVDLGTPLVAGADEGDSFISNCKNLLRATPLNNPKVVVAIIDEGNPSSSAFDNFGGRLHQIGTGLAMNDHAVRVLWTLIERLQEKGILDQAELYCALVPKATLHFGRECFTHGNCPETLSALKLLHEKFDKESLPVVVNISMGTHIGPHNGDSPLERFIAEELLSPLAKRYFFVSAGNDGSSGVSGSRSLSAGQPDFLTVRAQPTTIVGEIKILIEFWWRQAEGGNLTIDVHAEDEFGGDLVGGKLRIDPDSQSGVQLQERKRHSEFSSLFHANCHNGMSCIAFAVTRHDPIHRKAVELSFTLRSERDSVVNAWIAVCSDKMAHFVSGTEATNLRVPSTLNRVICVSGVGSDGNPWRGSSRGPAASYDFGSTGNHYSPRMAHLVELPGQESGTSYASPRAAADAAAALIQNSGSDLAPSPQELVELMLGPNFGPWRPQKGYGSMI